MKATTKKELLAFQKHRILPSGTRVVASKEVEDWLDAYTASALARCGKIVVGPAERESWRRQWAMAEKLAKLKREPSPSRMRRIVNDLNSAYEQDKVRYG